MFWVGDLVGGAVPAARAVPEMRVGILAGSILEPPRVSSTVSSVRRAVILGGTGAIGWAAASRLLGAGWEVVVTGRDPGHVPPGLEAAGGRFLRADRDDSASLPEVVGDGADLLVDCVCYTAAHAAALVPLLAGVTSTVMISSKAVYIDEAGRHSNSDDPPVFLQPVSEDIPTLRPNNTDYDSREGYGPNKVAAEEVLLDSGRPVTVIRPSKVHGAWSRQPREWVFVRRVLDRRPAVLLARSGAGADHPSAAVNIAALIEVVASQPGPRVLNGADPDCPNGLQIARTVAAHLGYDWEEILLLEPRPDGLGAHPWDRIPPVVLDTTAAVALGYQPVGDYASTVADELDWLVTTARSGGSPDLAGYLPTMFDYALEDDYLARCR
jgi:nucleoside-diphosphate-sugar epimerase